MLRYSIVIPCYRSAACLQQLVNRIVATMDLLGQPYEVILVNDASPDETWSEIQQAAQQHAQVRGVDLLFNTGQFRASLCGLEESTGQIVVLMDDDLQHRPEEIPRLITAIEENDQLDCVMARFPELQQTSIRRWGSQFANALFARLYNRDPKISGSSFRALRRTLVDAVCQHGTINPMLGPLIFKSTKRLANVEVAHQPRSDGSSGYRLRQLVRLVLDAVFTSTTIPLMCVRYLGMISAALSLWLGLFYAVRYAAGYIRYPGFVTEVLLIVFFGGATLFSIGLIGEYLFRVVEEVRRPPRYAIRSRTDDPETPG